jgi:hypothetical protein
VRCNSASKTTCLLETTNHMPDSNSPHSIQQRIQSGRVGWAGPLALTTARVALILLVQIVVAAAWLIHGDTSILCCIVRPTRHQSGNRVTEPVPPGATLGETNKLCSSAIQKRLAA